MTKKPKVDYVGAMGSELRDSAFFRREQGSQAPADTQSEPDESSVAAFVGRRQPREEKAVSERPNARTPERANERAIVRQSYEIYKDQHAALRGFSIEEMQRGERGSMSEMVREALDAYITKRKRQRA
jgi:hypothetical protein